MHLIDIPAILAKHNAEHDYQVSLFHLESGVYEFPVIGMSGGVTAASVVYFYVGELETRDLGRKGLVRHLLGFSWAVELQYSWRANAVEKLLAELNNFDELLRAEKWIP